MKQTFTVDILETWIKKVKVEAETRNDALAKAKADYMEECGDIPEGIAFEEGAERDNVDFRLEWPDGNPKEIKG